MTATSQLDQYRFGAPTGPLLADGERRVAMIFSGQTLAFVYTTGFAPVGDGRFRPVSVDAFRDWDTYVLSASSAPYLSTRHREEGIRCFAAHVQLSRGPRWSEWDWGDWIIDETGAVRPSREDQWDALVASIGPTGPESIRRFMVEAVRHFHGVEATA